MLRSYRGIVIALGLALIGAGEPPKATNQTEQSDPGAQMDRAANTVATAITNANKPEEKDAGCVDQSDKRHSDLCAQWKAADAARDAANLALWTLLISTIGTGLLVWTLWETRQTSRRELRAYLSIAPEPLIGLPDNPNAQICIRNAGTTPAHGARFSLIGRVDDPDLSEQAIEELHKRVAATNDNEMFIAGQQELFRPLPILDGVDEAMLNACREGIRWLYIVGRITYTDVFGKERHTWFCHTYFGTNLRPGLYRFGNRGD